MHACLPVQECMPTNLPMQIYTKFFVTQKLCGCGGDDKLKMFNTF